MITFVRTRSPEKNEILIAQLLNQIDAIGTRPGEDHAHGARSVPRRDGQLQRATGRAQAVCPRSRAHARVRPAGNKLKEEWRSLSSPRARSFVTKATALHVCAAVKGGVF